MRTSQNPPSRDCLETSRRVLDRLCLVLQEGEMGHFRLLLATRYTPNRGLFGLSRQSLEAPISPAALWSWPRSAQSALKWATLRLLGPSLWEISFRQPVHCKSASSCARGGTLCEGRRLFAGRPRTPTRRKSQGIHGSVG